jgi:hypothetical protein
MKCTCTENEICEAHRLVWDFQNITQKLGNLLEAELDSNRLYNLLPIQGDTHEKGSNLSEQILEGTGSARA